MMIDRSERIRIAIKNKGLSYADLEFLTGVSKSALQRYATGQTKKIPIDVIEKIATATGVSSRYLMGWDDETEKVAPETLKSDPQLEDVMKVMSENDWIYSLKSMSPENRNKMQEMAELLLLKQAQDDKAEK